MRDPGDNWGGPGGQFGDPRGQFGDLGGSLPDLKVDVGLEGGCGVHPQPPPAQPLLQQPPGGGHQARKGQDHPHEEGQLPPLVPQHTWGGEGGGGVSSPPHSHLGGCFYPIAWLWHSFPHTGPPQDPLACLEGVWGGVWGGWGRVFFWGGVTHSACGTARGPARPGSAPPCCPAAPAAAPSPAPAANPPGAALPNLDGGGEQGKGGDYGNRTLG